jgi:hypothetical protein
MRVGACLESVREATGEGGEYRLGVTLAELGTRLIAKRLENHDGKCRFDSHSLRISTPQLSPVSDFSNLPQGHRRIPRYCANSSRKP